MFADVLAEIEGRSTISENCIGEIISAMKLLDYRFQPTRSYGKLSCLCRKTVGLDYQIDCRDGAEASSRIGRSFIGVCVAKAGSAPSVRYTS
jgi:hypothetical protein